MTITMGNMKDLIVDVTFSEIRSISMDEESKKSGDKKLVTLRIKYDGLSLGDIFAKAFKTDCVSWQNGSGGRKNYDNIKNHQIIDVNAKSPGGTPQIDPEQAMIAKLSAMTDAEKKTYIDKMIADAKAIK